MTATLYTQQTIQEQEQDTPCVEFSAMGFGSLQSEASVSTSSTASSLSGWGSAVSRKSYACLKTLGEEESRKLHRPPRRMMLRQESAQLAGPAWGYFVDTTD